MHYLRRMSLAIVAGEHRHDTDGDTFSTGFRSRINWFYDINKKGENKMQPDTCWRFLNRKTGAALGWNCFALLQLSSTFKKNIWTCKENKKSEGKQRKRINTTVCFSARFLTHYFNLAGKVHHLGRVLLTKHTQGSITQVCDYFLVGSNISNRFLSLFTWQKNIKNLSEMSGPTKKYPRVCCITTL